MRYLTGRGRARVSLTTRRIPLKSAQGHSASSFRLFHSNGYSQTEGFHFFALIRLMIATPGDKDAVPRGYSNRFLKSCIHDSICSRS
jgi:hypothetical protein